MTPSEEIDAFIYHRNGLIDIVRVRFIQNGDYAFISGVKEILHVGKKGELFDENLNGKHSPDIAYYPLCDWCTMGDKPVPTQALFGKRVCMECWKELEQEAVNKIKEIL